MAWASISRIRLVTEFCSFNLGPLIGVPRPQHAARGIAENIIVGSGHPGVVLEAAKVGDDAVPGGADDGLVEGGEQQCEEQPADAQHKARA